ncbi:MAG: hypothetical protein XD91_0450 [Clostridiales bacterium 38_11]|nr:MAG: hypothetical protein XD91_0450 [Clostridiales bacterium 38_11]HBH12313.1 hypothetical protein [Clostridiales bacterium]
MRIKLLILSLVMALFLASCTQASDNTAETSTTEAEEEVLLTQGVYIGRIDPNFIEVETINGTIVFKLHMDEEAGYIDDLMSYTAVDIEYVINSENQNQIKKIVKADELEAPLGSEEIEVSGIITRFMDNQVIFVESDGTQDVFWIPVKLFTSTDKALEVGDQVTLKYYTDSYGRNMILFFQNSDQSEINQQYRTETGRYNGISNEGSLEIKITGVPDAMAIRQYIVDDDVIQAVNDLDLKIDDVVRIHYYINESGDNMLVDIEKM